MLLEEDKRGILLESGTNEIEVMEFTINESLYGINVAKVKEILVSQPVKHMPHAHPAVESMMSEARMSPYSVWEMARSMGQAPVSTS